MREIKFRVWDIEECRMINPKKMMMVRPMIDVFGNLGIMDISDNCEWKGIVPRHQYKLMQYTNFKDCNDRYVYEGDILEFEWTENSCWGDEGTYKGYIEFKEGGFEVIYIDRKETTKCEDGGQHVNNMSDNLLDFVRWTQPINIKVIGNIYENQDLLN